MGLRNIKIHTTTVMYRDEPIVLRGISAGDLMLAAQDYGPQIALIFGKFASGELDTDLKKATSALAKEAPTLLGAVIAMANDDYDPAAVETASKLPFNVQVECIEAIFAETFYSEADVKKLIESLTKMATATSGVLTEVSPSITELGIGGFDGRLAS